MLFFVSRLVGDDVLFVVRAEQCFLIFMKLQVCCVQCLIVRVSFLAGLDHIVFMQQ